MRSIAGADIYGITGEEHSLGRDNITVVKAMIDAGITLIQYREKEKSMLERYRQCEVVRRLTQDAGVTFIVNDHVDLALAVEADGLHVGQDDLPIPVVRKLAGESMIIGLSTHSPAQAAAAVAAGADYIGVGPIFTTQTKKDVCDAVGLTYLDHVVKNEKIPFVAIGGIKEHNIAEVKAHGAETIALVTEIVGAKDISKRVKAIRKAMERN
ncbi:thiamine phosphate synthase [Desulfoluna butyratoxydans]|uniref:Thiamine-phosphate synthase n=1 Tax=Desulfoluna butyratoxydans TaxID=231438 RepID=A0A4U8YTG8_9BACT|nr:thiamine phosphate synthase [Desulfoluna butyratoxydans]VFQ45152.1 thiamine phosphate synthase/teni [Desulfoluna butyratoxydans]